jgi:hypothetical protein
MGWRGRGTRARSMGESVVFGVVGRGDATLMVGSTTYPWCTSYRCTTDFYVSGAPHSRVPWIDLPPFLEHGPTELSGAWKCGAPWIHVICMAHIDMMRHGCGGLPPPALVLVGAHICVAHLTSSAPRIRQNLWRIFWGAPQIIIRGALKRGAS